MVRMAVGVLSGGVGLSALGLAFAGVTMADRPIWILFGFELITLVGAITGLFFALGRFRDGPALALVCVAATFFVASVLGWLSARGTPFLGANQGQLLKAWLFGRIGASGLLVLMASWLVLSRGGRTWQYASRAAIAGAPVLLLLLAAVLLRGKLSSAIGSFPNWALGGIGLIVGVGFGALVCAALHCTIRAFEEGRPRQSRT